MDQEVAKLKEMMTEVEITKAASMKFCKGKLNGTEAVVVRAGVGKVKRSMLYTGTYRSFSGKLCDQYRNRQVPCRQVLISEILSLQQMP